MSRAPTEHDDHKSSSTSCLLFERRNSSGGKDIVSAWFGPAVSPPSIRSAFLDRRLTIRRQINVVERLFISSRQRELEAQEECKLTYTLLRAVFVSLRSGYSLIVSDLSAGFTEVVWPSVNSPGRTVKWFSHILRGTSRHIRMCTYEVHKDAR